MQQSGNCGDELSLYLCARMCTRHIAITKTSVWYTGKFNDGKDFIGLNDEDLILVYLGKGVFERPRKGQPVCSTLYLYQKLHLQEVPTMSHHQCTTQNLPAESPTPGPWEHPRCWTVTKQSQHLRQPLQQPLQSQNHIITGSQNRLL